MEEKEYDLIISENDALKRIDVFLSENIRISRAMGQKLIDDGSVLVNNAKTKSSYKLKLDDRVFVKIPKPKESKISSQNMLLLMLCAP